MNFELRQAQKKYEEEQARARERAKRKAERERRVREEAEVKRAAEEEAQRRIRLEEAARAAELQRQAEADLERGDGIALRRVLRIIASLPGERNGDKITLPPSMLEDLPLDEALERGPMLFEVSPVLAASVNSANSGTVDVMMMSASGGGEKEEEDKEMRFSTHVGVREFTAPEGFVGLPEHVLRNLQLKLSGINLAAPNTSIEDALLSGQLAIEQVRVRYVKLPKGTYAQLVPVGRSGNGFSQLIKDQKAALESHLRSFTTLTVGDVLELTPGTQRFTLQVTQLKPERSVSIIDTDMEVDILPPNSTAQHNGNPKCSLPQTGLGPTGGVPLRSRKGVTSSGGPIKVAEDQVVAVLEMGKEARAAVRQGHWRYFKVSDSTPGPGNTSAPGSTSGPGSGNVEPVAVPSDLVISVRWDGAESRGTSRPEHQSQMGAQKHGTDTAATSSHMDLDTVQDGAHLISTVRSLPSFDVDLYVSVPPMVHPSLLDHVASSTGVGPKELLMSPSKMLTSAGVMLMSANEMLGAELVGQLVVGVYGFSGEGEFVIKVERRVSSGQGDAVEVASEGNTQRDGEGEGMKLSKPGVARCGNCGKSLPERTLVLHEAFCRRNNAVCSSPSCGAVLLKSDLEKGVHRHCGKCGVLFSAKKNSDNGRNWQQNNQAGAGASSAPGQARGVPPAPVEDADVATVASEEAKHMAVHHAPLQCPCGVELELKDMVLHRQNDCPHRWILCRFCGSSVPAEGTASLARDAARGLTAHEARCGSRTAPCDSCGAKVTLKDMDLHLEAFHAPGSSERFFNGKSNKRTVAAPPTREPSPTRVATQGKVDHHVAQASSHDYGIPMEGMVTGMKQSLNVECPICGEKVHSERDLSHHIDVVH